MWYLVEQHHLLTHFCAMSPITALFTDPVDPLGLHLLDEHQRRYERIKAWRESQNNPYFTEVSPQWREEFRKEELE